VVSPPLSRLDPQSLAYLPDDDVVLRHVGEELFRDKPSEHVKGFLSAESMPALPQEPAKTMTFPAECRVLGSSSNNFAYLMY
jgi:hypothetical protein